MKNYFRIRNKLFSKIVIPWLVLAAACSSALAEPEVTTLGDFIIAKHVYFLGDNDSKADASRICFLEANKKAVEYAGVYIESALQIKQTDRSRSSSSDIKLIAAALMSSETTSVSTGVDNGRIFLTCEVRSRVEKNRVKEDYAKIAADPSARQQLENQQTTLKKLEDEIKSIQARLQMTSNQQSDSLRQERSVVFNKIDEEMKKRVEIVSLIEGKGKDAKTMITRGMTPNEVQALIGHPRARAKNAWLLDTWNYGTHWVIFNYGLVCAVQESPSTGCY